MPVITDGKSDNRRFTDQPVFGFLSPEESAEVMKGHAEAWKKTISQWAEKKLKETPEKKKEVLSWANQKLKEKGINEHIYLKDGKLQFVS